MRRLNDVIEALKNSVSHIKDLHIIILLALLNKIASSEIGMSKQ